jgi:hypothetical protein
MAQITILPGEHGHDPGPRRGFLAAAGRFVRTVAKILAALALGVGLATGGYCIAASSSSILMSSDKTLLQLIAAEPPVDAGRDPFSTRDAAPPEETPSGKRTEALLSYSLGLIMALTSLGGFGLAWSETAEAFEFYRGDA